MKNLRQEAYDKLVQIVANTHQYMERGISLEMWATKWAEAEGYDPHFTRIVVDELASDSFRRLKARSNAGD